MAEKKEKMSACSYNQFMEALEELKAQRPDSKAIEELFSVLSMMEDDWGTFKEKEFIGTKKQINKHLNDSRSRAKKAFSKLSREELGALINYIEREFKRSFDRNQIINEYIEELRKHCKEPSKTNDYDYDHGIDNSWGDDDWGFTNQDGLDSTYGDPFAPSSTYRNSSRRNRPGISISNPFAGLSANRKREKLPLCNYNHFMEALEELKNQRPDSKAIEELFSALSMVDRNDWGTNEEKEFIGTKKQINKHLNDSRSLAKRAFSKLSREELGALVNYIEREFKRSFDRNQIIDEYIEELRKHCKEPSKTNDYDYDHGIDDDWGFTNQDGLDSTYGNSSRRNRPGISISNPFAANRRREKLPLCNYNLFMEALEELKAQRPDSAAISSLYNMLSMEYKDFTGSRNQINSYLNRCTSDARRLFHKLSREELGTLIYSIESKYKRRFDKAELLKEYIEELKKHCKEPTKQNNSSYRRGSNGDYDYDYDYDYDSSSPDSTYEQESYDAEQTKTTPIITGRRQRKNMMPCTHDILEEAVKELKAQRPDSPGITNLLFSLGVKGRELTGSRNQINSTITRIIVNLRRAFNKLSREEMGALVSIIENKYNKRLDKGVIIYDFGEKLKKEYMKNSIGRSYPSEEAPDYAHGYSASTRKKFKSAGPAGQFAATRKEYNPYMDRVTALQIPKDYKYKYSYYIAPLYGESIVRFIDRTFNKQTLEKFDSELINISPFDTTNYIAESNKLIEAIVDDALLYDTEEAKKKIIAAVKDNYGLEFSPSKLPEEVLKELISDELRFYQQKILEGKLNGMDTTFLGTSKRISKDIWEQRMVLEDLRTFTLPSYAFTEEVIDNYPIDIVTDRKQLPKDYASRYLTGGSFGEQTAQVIITKGSDGTYRVSNALGKILQ